MSHFPIHTIDSAPEPSRALLVALKQAVGMVPNLAAGMAESPALLGSFLAVRDIYQKGSLTGAEIQVLSLVAAYENDCAWCVAFHSLLASKEGVSASAIDALRDGHSPNDVRLEALSDFARVMVQRRGAVPPEALDRFFAAGYTRAQALEVVLGMGFSLMANYAGHLIDPALDQPLVPRAWQRSHAAHTIPSSIDRELSHS